MSVQLAIANISLETATVGRQGFQGIMFAAKHNLWSERIRTYTDADALLEDGFSADDAAYKALRGGFSQTPRPQSIKVGRANASTVLNVTEDVVDGLEYNVTVNALGSLAALEISVTAGTGETKQDILDQVVTAITGNADLNAKITASVTGTGNDAILTLSHKVGDDWFTVTNLLNLSTSAGAVEESAAEMLAAIAIEDDSWYYITSEEKSVTFIEELAAEVEARFKLFRYTTKEEGAYAAVLSGSVKTVKDNQYFRTMPEYHHLAEDTYPEVAALAEIATFTTGRVTYHARIVSGVPAALNATGGNLTATQVSNMKSNEVNFYDKVQISGASFSTNPSITYGGKVASGELTMNIVTRDNLQVDLEATTTELMIRQKNGRLAFDETSLNKVRGAVRTVLNQYESEDFHNFLLPNTSITIPRVSEINAADKAANVFKQVSFKGTLRGAIHMIEITGTLGN
ncbi:hypothetical protein [Pseudoalteromonas phage J2-1]|uniref:Tail sheath protein n=1 Tax=Pseudoalteromonas phage J2-1 TaxID=2023998 RepID=A0A223LHN1_9CAUD|nr:tail sheath [Pseudoalteromonas phage J2-1]ASU03373.1 hypothetical protein [Pseudoalteromonas phage J2-1]